MKSMISDSQGVSIWSAVSFILLMTSIQMIRVMKDDLAIVTGLEHLPWLISITFITIVISSYIIYLVKNSKAVYAVITLILSISAICCYAYQEITILSGMLYTIFSALSLVVIAQFWAITIPLVNHQKSSTYYRTLIVSGTIGSISGPIAVILCSQSALAILTAIFLLSTLVCLSIARSYSHTGHRSLEASALATDQKHNQSFVWFVLLYSLVATFLYYQQLEIIKNYFPDANDRIVLFGIRDLFIGVLTLSIHLIINLYKINIAKYFSLMPFLSIWIFIGVGLFPALIPIVSAIVIFRTGNFTITKPGRELFYKIRPNMSQYKSLIDAAIYRGGDLLGIWMFAALKYLNADQLIINMSILPLVIIWFLISKKISLMIN